MLVGREQHPVAVAPRVRVVGQSPEAEQIGSGVQREAVGRFEPCAGQDLLGGGEEALVSQLKEVRPLGHAISLGERA